VTKDIQMLIVTAFRAGIFSFRNKVDLAVTNCWTDWQQCAAGKTWTISQWLYYAWYLCCNYVFGVFIYCVCLSVWRITQKKC